MTGKQMAACAATLATVWFVGNAAASVDRMPNLTRAAGIPVYCWHNEQFPWNAMGIYDAKYERIYLPDVTCGYLKKVRRGDEYDAAVGLLVLGHEIAHHTTGLSDDDLDVLDCISRKRVGILARKLGATWKRSQKIVRAQSVWAPPTEGSCR